MHRSLLLCLFLPTLGAAAAAQGYASNFESLVASATGTPMAGQDGFFVPAVAGSIDGALYTYAGNSLGIPVNPNGGANFYAGNSLGGTSLARSQRTFTLPGTGLVNIEFDVCCSYNGTVTPINNIGSFSFQPSGTSRFPNLVARWPVGVTFPPTTWDADLVVGPTAAGVATAFPHPDFHGLALNVWHHWTCVINLTSGEYVSFEIRNGVTGKTSTYRATPGSMPLPNPAAPQPTDFRFFTGGGAGNIFAIDNFSVAPQVLVPAGQATQASSSTTTAFRTTLGHLQCVYDSTLFTAAGVTGPISIHRLRFRGEDGEVNAGGQVYSGVTVRMSSSPLDHAALSTTYAANVGLDVATVFTGNLTVLPSNGAVPNNSNLEIALTTPFTYDPSLGLDLNIDIDMPAAPAPNPTSMISMATSSTLATHKGRLLTTATAGATTGTLSALAPVCLIDFTGAGGQTPIGARVLTYGAGCNTAASSIYETFGIDNFDLASLGGLTFTPAGADNYTVTAGASPVVPPIGTVPNQTDDGVVALTLPFPFVYPGNPAGTTAIAACTNGYVWLANNTVGDFSPTVAEFLGNGTSNYPGRFAVCWHDLHAGRNATTHPGSGLYVDLDTSNPVDTVALVTWLNVGEFNQVSATGGHSVNTFQCALHQSGVVEFRYGAMNLGAAGTKLVGFSRGSRGAGLNATDPGSRDLSKEIPVTTTGPDGAAVPLTLAVNARPQLGAALTFTTSNISATSVLSVNALGWAGFSPGQPVPGAPGCLLSVDINTPGLSFLQLLIGTPSATNLLNIPTNAAFVGAQLYTQSISLDPVANPLGVTSSNALGLLIGL